MDLEIILHFVFANIEKILIVTVLLSLVTGVMLIIRDLKGQSQQTDNSLDIRSVEGALKRVLAAQPPTVVERPAGEGEPSNIADLAPLKNALADKEKQLAAMNAELAEAKAAAAAAASTATAAPAQAAAPSQESQHAIAGLEMEIADLKAKLAEYEIIEDDIADLALFKEENARLKREIEEARTSGAATAAPAAAPVAEPVVEAAIEPEPVVEANAAAGIQGLTEALEQEAAAKAAPAPTPAPAQAAAAPVDSLGSPDTDKMLQEAESLSSVNAEDEPEINALSDLLDTDKLLEEVNSLDAQDVMSEFKDKSKLG